jgi:hypothetical protein
MTLDLEELVVELDTLVAQDQERLARALLAVLVEEIFQQAAVAVVQEKLEKTQTTYRYHMEEEEEMDSHLL